MKEILFELLVKREGLRLFPYKCTAGYWTIGVGRNIETKGLSKEEFEYLGLDKFEPSGLLSILTERGITKQEAYYLLSNDIDYFTTELHKRLPFLKSQPETAQIVLIDMSFNLGVKGLLNFKKTLRFIENKDYLSASKEMLNSAWKFQVGDRAYELSNMLKTIQS